MLKSIDKGYLFFSNWTNSLMKKCKFIILCFVRWFTKDFFNLQTKHSTPVMPSRSCSSHGKVSCCLLKLLEGLPFLIASCYMYTYTHRNLSTTLNVYSPPSIPPIPHAYTHSLTLHNYTQLETTYASMCSVSNYFARIFSVTILDII